MIASAIRKIFSAGERGAEQRQHAEGKGNIRRRRNRPAVTARDPAIKRQEISAGTTIPPSAAITGKPPADGWQASPASAHVSLQGQPAGKHRHQRIIDPQQHVLIDFQRPNLERNGRFQKA
jgi:hypothetical protein